MQSLGGFDYYSQKQAGNIQGHVFSYLDIFDHNNWQSEVDRKLTRSLLCLLFNASQSTIRVSLPI